MPTYDYDDPAVLACEEIRSVLIARRDAGDFDAILADISSNIGRTIEAANVDIELQYNPQSRLENVGERIMISLLPGPELVDDTDFELFNRAVIAEDPMTHMAVDTLLDHANSSAIRHLMRLARLCSLWTYFVHPDPPTGRRKLRRLQSINCVATRWKPWTTYDPAVLRNSPVFFSFRQFEWEALV